jgi:hypothetical protein
MVVLIQVPSAVATRSVGENASPFPLLSVGASVGSFACEGPCVAEQCKSPSYRIEILTMSHYAARFAFCHVESKLTVRFGRRCSNDKALMTNDELMTKFKARSASRHLHAFSGVMPNAGGGNRRAPRHSGFGIPSSFVIRISSFSSFLIVR